MFLWLPGVFYDHTPCLLGQWFSKCVPGTSSISITQEIVRNANYFTPWYTNWIRISRIRAQHSVFQPAIQVTFCGWSVRSTKREMLWFSHYAHGEYLMSRGEVKYPGNLWTIRLWSLPFHSSLYLPCFFPLLNTNRFQRYYASLS